MTLAHASLMRIFWRYVPDDEGARAGGGSCLQAANEDRCAQGVTEGWCVVTKWLV